MHFIHKVTIHFILLVVSLSFFANPAQASTPHKPITQKLITLLEEKPSLKTLLESSLRESRKINPDLATNPAQNLQDYFDYIDEAAELIPQVVLNNPKSLIRDQILQSICYFYYLVDQPLADLKGKGYFKNTIQYDPQFSAWLREFADAWGEFLDTEESWNNTTY